MLSEYELERFKRQITLDGIGIEGQQRLIRSRVAVVGAGGLGSPALLYLAGLGVGFVRIIDCDVVSLSNLNRQILYGDSDIGRSKAKLAAQRARRFYPDIQAEAVDERLTDENAAELLSGVDAALLCLDSTEARRCANRALVKTNVPFVDAAVRGFSGTVLTVIPGVTPCWECLYGEQNKNVSGEIPVLGATVGMTACAQVLAALRLLLGREDPTMGRLLCIDGTTFENDFLELERDPGCPACGKINLTKINQNK